MLNLSNNNDIINILNEKEVSLNSMNNTIEYSKAKDCLQNFLNIVMNHKDEIMNGINIVTITDEQVDQWHEDGLVIAHHDDDEALFWIDGHLFKIKIHYREILDGIGHEAYWKILD